MKKIEVIETKRGKRIRVCTINDTTIDPDRTDQSQAADCDINNIVRRYKKTGQISHLAKSKGVYADLSLLPDTLLDAHMMIQQASDAFMQLPAEVRKKFRNDPEEMIQFLNDPKNSEEAIKLGLLVRKDPPTNTGTSSEGNRPETKPSGRGQSSNKQKNSPPPKNDDDPNDDE